MSRLCRTFFHLKLTNHLLLITMKQSYDNINKKINTYNYSFALKSLKVLYYYAIFTIKHL